MNSITTGILVSALAVFLTIELIPDPKDYLPSPVACSTDSDCERLNPEIARELNHRAY